MLKYIQTLENSIRLQLYVMINISTIKNAVDIKTQIYDFITNPKYNLIDRSMPSKIILMDNLLELYEKIRKLLAMDEDTLTSELHSLDTSIKENDPYLDLKKEINLLTTVKLECELSQKRDNY